MQDDKEDDEQFSSSLSKIAKKFREMQLMEEIKLDRHHTCLSWETAAKTFTGKNLTQFIGFVRDLPVAYAGFFVCPCAIFVWKFFYILPPFRKLGFSLRFAREIVRLLHRRLGPSLKVEITYNVNNEPMRAIGAYLGIDSHPNLQYVTGVVDVAKISCRRGSGAAGQTGH